MKIFRWRWKAVLVSLAGIIIGAYAASFLPFVKPPYAMASVVGADEAKEQRFEDYTNGRFDAVNGKLNIILAQQHNGQVRQATNDLLEALRYKCRGMNSSDKSTLSFWTKRLETLEQGYRDLTNDNWPEVPCASF